MLQNAVLLQLAPKIPNIVSHYEDDPNKYKRDLLKVEIYFDNLNLVIIREEQAYPVINLKYMS